MNRIWSRHLLSFAAFALLASVFAPGCAKNDESIFIRNVLAPSQNRTGGFCSWTSDPTQTFLPISTLDVGIRDDYRAVALIGNQMIPRGDPLAPTAESNRIHIDGAVVRVTNPDGSEVAPSFTSFSAGVADPQNNNNPGYVATFLTIIDGNTAKVLRDQIKDNVTQKEILVFFRAFGRTLGGVDVESGEYQQPMRVCNGCLVFFPESARDPAAKQQPNCLKAFDPATATGVTAIPCFPGEDESTSCQFCRGRPACDPPATP